MASYNISSGVISTGIYLSSSDRMSISFGGVANSTTVSSGGRLYIYRGGVANSTTVNNWGSMHIYSGGVANSTTVNSVGGMCISSGGVANSTTLNRGWMYIYSGGEANSTTVNRGGMYIRGVANSTTINSGGSIYISSGGEANSTTVNEGYMDIYRGGVANSTTVNGGDMYISSGGIANSITINFGGYMYIYSGGTATAIRENGGYVDVADGANVTFASNTITGLNLPNHQSMTVHSNTVANSTIVNFGGHMFICYGGEANNTTINSRGSMYIYSGGVANSTTVNYGGRMYISSGGVAKGGLDISSKAIVSAYEGAVIDFTVTERTVSDGYMINDLSLVSGAPTYTITVNADQEYGTYKLAQNAQDISSTLTVNTESGNIGTLTVNGDVLEYNDRQYTLTNSNGNLHLSVQDKNAVTAPDTNLLTNGVSQILAWDAEQGKVGYMATDGNVRPAWKGVWEWSGAEADLWRVAGVGHFKGSEVDYDGVLLYNGVGNCFAAWTDLRKGSYGYVNLCKVDGSFNTQCLANLDGDQYDDILIYDTNGSIGVVLDGTTYKDIWHVNKGEQAKWTIEGAGSFDDGADKLVMVNNDNNFVYLWTNNDPTFSSWNWSTKSVGKLESGWEVAAVGDFEGDGIDDIMVLDRNTNNVWVWDDGNSQTKRWRGTLGEGFEIEAAGDYNGDGCADLLLREHNTGWGGLGYWGNGYAGNWVDLKARIETDLKSSFDIIA